MSEALRAMARRVWRERRRRQVMSRFATKVASEADRDRAELEAEVSRLHSRLADAEAKHAKLRAERAAVDYTAVTTGSVACGEAALRLRQAAAGRREYMGSGPYDDALESQAGTIEMCAQVVEGDLTPLTYWLPTWRWTDDMTKDTR